MSYFDQASKTTVASFRDPAGCLFAFNNRIARIIKKSGLADFNAFMASSTSKVFIESGRLVRTTVLDAKQIEELLDNSEIASAYKGEEGAIVVEHDRIPFQSYPYEWPPEMLHSAGCLTLDLAESLLAEGLGLKDATPYNILFQGPGPVFIDLLSAERRVQGDSIWLPSAQFERTFLLPLLANKYFGLTISELLASRRDGLEPEEVYQLCGTFQRLAPPFLTLVTLPTWLAARRNREDLTIYERKPLDNAEKARFILSSLLKRLRQMLDRLEPQPGKESAWSDYMSSNNNYSREHFKVKQDFVERATADFGPKRVLDVGCNDGHFSVIAARNGASVVAIDYDPVVVGDAWRKARAEALDILPLVINFSRPSPATGWRNRECPSFLDRASGAFDCVLMLAVIHHLLVSERTPLSEIIEVAAEITTDILIIEFIAPDDSMFRRLVRGRDNLFQGFTVEQFESTCRKHFEIIRSQHLEQSSRWLYLMRKKEVARHA